MSGPPVAKRHHTVPQFYLRGFAEADRIGTVRLPGEVRFVQSVGDASVAKNFYAVEGHQDGDDVIEKAMSEIEGATAAVVKAVTNGAWPLPETDRMTLGYFIALQAVRIPSQRRTMNHMARQMLRLRVGAGGKAGVRRELEKQGADVTDELVDEVWDLAMRPEGPPIERPKVEHIKQMLGLSETLMKYIVGRPWSLVDFDRRSLITSDDPVCLVRDPKDEDSQGVGFMTAWGITFPLTRKLGLLLGNIDPVIEAGVPVERVHEGGVDMRLAGTTQLEKFFNYQTVANASEWLFHHPDDAKFIPDDLPEPTPVTVEMDQIEFTGEPWFGQSNSQGSGPATSRAAES